MPLIEHTQANYTNSQKQRAAIDGFSDMLAGVIQYEASIFRRTFLLEMISESACSLNPESSPPLAIPPPTDNMKQCIRTFELTYSWTDIGWHAKPHMIISAISIGSVGTIVLVLFVWIIWRREEFGRTNVLNPVFVLARTRMTGELERDNLVDLEKLPKSSTVLCFHRVQSEGRDWAGGFVIGSRPAEIDLVDARAREGTVDVDTSSRGSYTVLQPESELVN
ncbi:hypothetical protein SISNIDRAFT_486204 [Sistotremastrum niveocremeum HHB9708]|uniref:Uncharacterized protein n=1 Tax=Sistotremastrum niveocremeum HHB9708 TaxID=1314777 RepID=A0A164TW35_9AGAM|nr:hypothetical protein SISNIDRAFT_486204 [Sistotremastrum niveocremeum HHB9708]